MMMMENRLVILLYFLYSLLKVRGQPNYLVMSVRLIIERKQTTVSTDIIQKTTRRLEQQKRYNYNHSVTS
jgi:hypothetical protein